MKSNGKLISCILLFLSLGCQQLFSQPAGQPQNNDRKYWADLLYNISAPILSNMSKGELKKNMVIEVSPTWLKGCDRNVTYMEAFGRLMSGLSPWLTLPDDETPEGRQRKQLRLWALASYTNAVNPDSPDYLLWEGEGQILCDASYIAISFMRSPDALWHPLNTLTKQRYIAKFNSLKSVRPAYNNWLLFRGTVEAFLLSIGQKYDAFALTVSAEKMNEWYVGDGWYSDGPEYSIDYYNGYVIQPMYVEMLEIMKNKKVFMPIPFELALKRMQRYNVLLERMISPEAAYPAMGRSMTYRLGAFQTLALSAWKYGLPESLSYGQVRNALTSVMKRMFSMEGNFGKEGFLQLGFVGHQPNLADWYTNNGSLYITSLGFLPLGLPASHPFWTSQPEDWTSKKAWSGNIFPKDYHESIKE